MTKYLLILVLFVLAGWGPSTWAAPTERPNVIFILTDDQGYSDVGFTGNPTVETPVLDQLAKESVVLDPFYAQPVCMPSRAAIMTGRHPYRAGVTDLGANGRSMLYPQEWTMAQAFEGAGYDTAIFGKWHLGDQYPLRPMDRGFKESIVHHAGMMGGEDSIPGERGYFDPLLFHNGVEQQYQGYCNDIYTAAALDFIKENRNNPFFIYYSTNLPHHPLIATSADEEEFLKKGLSTETSSHYGMIRNIDRNVGRLLALLDQLGLRDNTIILFMGDNGSSSLLVAKDRHESGLRGRKTEVYEGGIRVPCLINWPGHFPPAHIGQVTCTLDLMPTLLAAAGIPTRPGVIFDGVNLMPLLSGQAGDWPARNLYFEWDGGNEQKTPQNFAVRDSEFKLVHAPKPHQATSVVTPYELYDLKNDPFEKQDIAAKYPDKVAALKANFFAWRAGVQRDSGRPLPTIAFGHDVTPVLLGAWDRRGVEKDKPESGHWDINVEKAGLYEIIVRLHDNVTVRKTAMATLKIGALTMQKEVGMEEWEPRFEVDKLSLGPTTMVVQVQTDDHKLIPIDVVEVRFQTVQ